MTRIVCTVGPASADPGVIRRLIENGLNVVRLNFSHGTHEFHQEVIRNVRAISKEMGVYVGILQDLQGPKIRLGNLPEEGVAVASGEEVILRNSSDYEEGVLPVIYPNLHREVAAGETILLSDGAIELDVEMVRGEDVICRTVNGGQVFSHKGVNLPSSNLSVSSFSDKDRKDLIMGISQQVDFVALSFVRSSDDLTEVKKLIDAAEVKPKLIAKIEKPQAVKNIQSILKSVDAVMVARGDLGVEVPLERVPIIQKEIISAARAAGKEVILATQMLLSMMSSVRPTRGEVSDVANAVLDGADALMLSDESANGLFPVQACAMLAKIAQATEPYVSKNLPQAVDPKNSLALAVGRAACSLANDSDAAAIVAYTHSGYTAQAVAQFRPGCPIIALTPEQSSCRKLTLSWGVTPISTDRVLDNMEELVQTAKAEAKKTGLVKEGDRIVLTSGLPKGATGGTSLVRLLWL
jgi:pyruvate kinase